MRLVLYLHMYMYHVQTCSYARLVCTDRMNSLSMRHNRMGNVLPLIGPRKNTGNRVSVPNPFTGPVPLTSDLEPDRSDYFQFLLLTGNFINNVVYFQFLLLTGNLFVTDSFISCF